MPLSSLSQIRGNSEHRSKSEFMCMLSSEMWNVDHVSIIIIIYIYIVLKLLLKTLSMHTMFTAAAAGNSIKENPLTNVYDFNSILSQSFMFLVCCEKNFFRLNFIGCSKIFFMFYKFIFLKNVWQNFNLEFITFYLLTL